MNKSAIQKYAIWARNELIEKVTLKAFEYGVSKDEIIDANADSVNARLATVYKGNIIKNLIMDCQSYTKYRPNETTGGIFVSWRRKEELPTGLD